MRCLPAALDQCISGLPVCAVNTSGAVSFHHFEMQHAHYVVAANFREVLPNGETTTVARSAIYRLNASNPAGDVPTAPYIGGQVAPEKCSTDSPLGVHRCGPRMPLASGRQEPLP